MVDSRAAACGIIAANAIVAVAVIVYKRHSRSACIAADIDGAAVIVDSGAVGRLVGAVAACSASCGSRAVSNQGLS